MRRPPNSIVSLWIASVTLGFALGAGLVVGLAFPVMASEATTHDATGMPCAVVQAFEGVSRILIFVGDRSNPERVEEAKPGSPVDCGAWVSVDKGWLHLKRREGTELRLSAGSYAQMQEVQQGMPDTAPHVVLLSGQAWVASKGGTDELRILSANGRARVSGGQALVLYDNREKETQLISLGGTAILENRYDPSLRMPIHPGELTLLNLSLLRVLPTAPRAVSIATLKERLLAMALPELEAKRAIASVTKRQERRIAATLVTPDKVKTAQKEADRASEQFDSGFGVGTIRRGPASISEADGVGPDGRGESTGQSQGSSADSKLYERHTSDGNAQQSKLNMHLVTKLTGDQEAGERMLFPDKFYGRPRSYRVIASEVSSPPGFKQRKEELNEKKRLLEELSKLQENEE